MKKQVVWENLYEELPPIDHFELFHDDDDDEDDDTSPFEKSEKEEQELFKLPPQVRLTTSPFGVAPLNDPLNPRRQFNFCLGHTNFALTQENIATIAKVDGIETILFSRYRFIVAVAKLFDVQAVKLNIQTALCGQKISHDSVEDITLPTLKQQVVSIIAELEKYKLWAAYLLPNSKLYTIQSNNPTDKSFIAQLNQLQLAKQHSGGKLFVCKDLQ